MEFAQGLNYLMDTLQISAYKLSQETGIPQAMIGRWKNGQNPSTENLQKIADYFGVTTDYLMGNESPRYYPTKEALLLRRILGEKYQLRLVTTAMCVCNELSNGYILTVYCRDLDDTGGCDVDAEVWNYDQQPFVHDRLLEIKNITTLIEVLNKWEEKYNDMPPLGAKNQQLIFNTFKNIATDEHKDKLSPKKDEPDITFDDFTYAFLDESKELTEENKKKLLEMAKFFKEQQEKEKNK